MPIDAPSPPSPPAAQPPIVAREAGHGRSPQEVLKRVRKIEIRARRLVDQVVAGEYHATFRGQGLEFDQVREYCPGDDVRTIDWNVTARTGHPYIKTFVETRELTVILAVDCSASTRVGAAEETVAERLAEVGALLAFSAIRNNDKAGLLLFTDRVESFVPPRKGSHHCLRLIRDLLYPEVAGRGSDLGAALGYLSRVVRRRAVVFLLSDFLATGFGPDLRVASRRHEVVPVRLTDPLAEGLPAVGLTCLTDPEGGRPVWVDTASPAVRTAYAEARARHRAEVDRLFRGARLLPLDLPLAGDLVAPLRAYFHQRGMRR